MCVCISMYVCVYIYVCVCIYMCVCVYICVCVCVCIYTYACVCVYICMSVCVCVYIYIAHSSGGQESEVRVLPGGRGPCRASQWAPTPVSASLCGCRLSAALGLWLCPFALCFHLRMVFSAPLCILVMVTLVITFRACLANPGQAPPLSHVFCHMQ